MVVYFVERKKRNHVLADIIRGFILFYIHMYLVEYQHTGDFLVALLHCVPTSNTNNEIISAMDDKL